MKVSNNYGTAKLCGTWNKNVSKSSEKNKWKLTDSLKEKIVELAQKDAQDNVYMGKAFMNLRKKEVSKVAPDRAALIGKLSQSMASGNLSVMNEVAEADKKWLCMLFAMIIQREAEIDGFKPEPIYKVFISCGGITAVSDRFESKQDAEKILNRLKEEKTAQVTKIDPADKQEKAPQLYSLTALQRDANRYLGFTAQQTLDYTQSLYEKKLVTYPRTDSRFLTEDMAGMIPNLAQKMAHKFGFTKNVPVHAEQVINNSKVSDNNEIKELHNVWKKYQLLEKTGIKWEQILSNLYESTAPIVVRLVNQKAKEKGVERLDYEPYKETGLRVIAVGGNSLSRGLTLEGLSVSYFDRNSQMYDTLMQMGRWFGYRNGYDKLFKIWMEPAAIGWYMNMYIMYAHNCTA